MKKILIFLMFSILSVWLLAQTEENPFSKLGYKKDITYTMSKGQFDEVHDQMEIVEIGNVFFNTRTNKIVGYVGNEKDSADLSSATTAVQIDPHASRYPWITPYAFCANNPIRFVDPDGKDSFDIITLYVRFKLWAEGQMGAAQRLATGTSGKMDVLDEANVPEHIQKINKAVGYMQDIEVVAQGVIDVTEAVGCFPGMDLIADPIMGLSYATQGDFENAAPYALGVLIPGLSGGECKMGIKVISFIQGTGKNAVKITTAIPEGFRRVKSLSNGEKVFTNGKVFITPDNTGHTGGIWKMGETIEDLTSKTTRLGTYDELLNRIGD